MVGNKKKHKINLSSDKGCKYVNYFIIILVITALLLLLLLFQFKKFDYLIGTLKNLIFWIRDNLLKEREELFIQNDTM